MSAKNQHGVYTDREAVTLHDGKYMLAEVRVAETEGGWRAVTSFNFTTGNHWGSGGPITDHDEPFAHRDEAIAHAAAHLSERLANSHGVEPSMTKQRDKIIAWVSGLLRHQPAQMDMFA